MPDQYRDAFYQLVLFPVKACANLNELYITAGKNHLYAKQKRSLTNAMADRVKELFVMDSVLTSHFHTELSGGKWNHMMSQTHIGYTFWQQPEQNNMPEIKIVEPLVEARMGVAVEGSEKYWTSEEEFTEIGVFDPLIDQSFYIDI